MNNTTVGIVGVGNMGGAMARRLLALGASVEVCDLDPHKTAALSAEGASVVTDAAQFSAACALIIVCVVDADQTEAVLFGNTQTAGLFHNPHRQTVMLCPTIAPQDTARFAQRLAETGRGCIDAPMSGGPQRAQEGRMSLMVACSDTLFEANVEILNALSNAVFRISERLGDGARVKLCNNLLAGINLAGAAEVLALGERMGLDLKTLLAVMENSSAQSWIASDRMSRALDDDFAPRAHMGLLEKDTRLALEMARQNEIAKPDARPLSLGAAAHDAFKAAMAAGLADLDDGALLQWWRAQRM